MRKIIVAGSRNVTDMDLIEKEMRKLIGDSEVIDIIIITGKARGVDKIADYIATNKLKVATMVFPAHWDYYGTKRAGPIRNTVMLKEATELLAFPDKSSIGTRHMITIAKKAGLEVTVVEC